MRGPLCRKADQLVEVYMPAIGWIFIVVALALIVGSLMILRDNAHSMKISDEKMKKIQARKAEIEADESAEDREW